MSFRLETCCKIAVGLHMIKFKENHWKSWVFLLMRCCGDQFNTSSSIGYSQISMFPDHLYMSVMVQFTILLQASPRWLDDSILNSSLVMSIHSDSFFRYLIFLEKYWFAWKSPASCLKVVQNSQCFDLPVDPRCSFGVAFEYECPGGCQERLATWWCTNPNHKWWVLINHPAASIMRWDRTCFVWLMFSTWRNKIQFTELGVNGIKNATVTETNIPTYEWYQVLVRTHDSS